MSPSEHIVRLAFILLVVLGIGLVVRALIRIDPVRPGYTLFATFVNLQDAERARSYLSSHGIHGEVEDRRSTYRYFSLGPYILVLPKGEADRADRLLKDMQTRT